jgi:sugar phosphate isomerase/epimerase
MKLAFVVPVGKNLKDFSSKIKKIAKLGYQGVELAVQDPKKINVTRVKEIIARDGLIVPTIATGSAYIKEGLSLSSPKTRTRIRAIERIKNQIEFAKQFETMVTIGLVRGNINESKKGEKKLARSLKECARFAQAKGVKLVLEAINRYEMDFLPTLSETKRFIKKWKIPNCGILADTYHMNIEEKSIKEAFKKNISLIWHVHLADNNRLAPGQGHIDFKKVLRILKRIGYKGWFTAEILYQPSFEKSAKLTIAHLKS